MTTNHDDEENYIAALSDSDFDEMEIQMSNSSQDLCVLMMMMMIENIFLEMLK